MKRYYYVDQEAKKVMVCSEEQTSIQSPFVFIGASTHPNPKAFVSLLLKGETGYSITIFDDTET